MDVWDLTKLLARRWYFAVPFLIATMAGSIYLAVAIKPDYIVTSHLILTPAPAGDGSVETRTVLASNPWNALGTSALTQSGKLSIEGEEVVKDLKARGLSDSYTVMIDNLSPILTIEVVADTQAKAVATTETLVSMLQTNVKELQKSQGAPDAALMGTRRLPGDKLGESHAKVKRAVVAVGAAGALLSCGITVALDALIRRHRRGRKAQIDPFLGALIPLPSEAATSPVPQALLGETVAVSSGQPPEDSTIILPLSSTSRGHPRP